jgi:anti-sigma regulatory factor (Ser/Thr protein kinase)
MTVRFELRCDPSAPVQARRLLRTTLASAPQGRALGARSTDVELLLSELVSNAVVHGRCDHTVLTIDLSAPDRVRIEVSDPGRGGAVERRVADLAGAGGLGLHLVDRLASGWGHRDEPSRRTVWFEVELGAGSHVGATEPVAGTDVSTPI